MLEVENLRDEIPTLELSETVPSRNTELVAWGTPSIPTLSGTRLSMVPTKANLHDVREEGGVDLWTKKPLTELGKTKWLYLDGKILPGNSGGPVVDPRTGRVVGVISMGTKQPGSNEGIATSVEEVRKLLQQIPTQEPLTKPNAEAAIRNLLEAFLPLSEPDPDIERFVSPRELGQLVQKRIAMYQQFLEAMALCNVGMQSTSPPVGLKEICDSMQQMLKHEQARDFMSRCVKDIPACARSTLGEEIQKIFREQFRYQEGKDLKSVKIIEGPTQDTDPRLWHVKANWSFGDETITERLILEQSHGGLFVRIFKADGTPVVKVEPRPEPKPRKPRAKPAVPEKRAPLPPGAVEP